MNRCLADERTVKIRIISQVLPAVTHDFLFHSTDPSFFHPLFVSKGLWKCLFSFSFPRAREETRNRGSQSGRREVIVRLPLEKERPSVEEKGNDWLPILESHACYWEPICSSFLFLGPLSISW